MGDKWSKTERVGRAFCRAIKAFPLLFLLVVGAGLAMGVYLTFFVEALAPRPLVLCRAIGVACFLFYGTLLWLFLSRQLSGTWGETCDYGCEIFGDRPAWREDLTAVDDEPQLPVATGIDVWRVQEFFGLQRGLAVYVDGRKVGALRFGGRKQFAIAPGGHDLHVEMDWCRSPAVEIEVRDGELTSLRCGTRWRYLFPLNIVGLVFWPARFFFAAVVGE